MLQSFSSIRCIVSTDKFRSAHAKGKYVPDKFSSGKLRTGVDWAFFTFSAFFEMQLSADKVLKVVSWMCRGTGTTDQVD